MQHLDELFAGIAGTNIETNDANTGPQNSEHVEERTGPGEKPSPVLAWPPEQAGQFPDFIAVPGPSTPNTKKAQVSD